MAIKKRKSLRGFYTYCLSTCKERRLKKIKWIMDSSKDLIKKDLFKLNVDDVVLFLSKLNQSNFSKWTKNDFKKIFKRFLKWAYNDLEMVEGSKVKLGFKGVSSLNAVNKEKISKDNLVTPEQLERFVRAAKTLKWKAIITFQAESAFRPCETNILRWKNLKFDDTRGICLVNIVSPKTGEQREIPIKDCIVHLKRWREEYQFPNRTENDFVFPSQHYREKPMGEGVMLQMFKRISKDAKLNPPIYPYLLRHTRIYELQKKLPQKIAAKFAGHSVETSELYNHLDNQDVVDSMLKDIYTTKELTAEEKSAMQKEIDDLKKKFSEYIEKEKGEMEMGKLFFKLKNKLITKQEYEKEMNNLVKAGIIEEI